MFPNPQFPADLVTFTEGTLDGKLHFSCSALASDMAVLYGKDTFSILVLSTKKRYSSFLIMVFVLKISNTIFCWL